MRQETHIPASEVAQALDDLAGKISDQDMQRLNYAVDGNHRDIKEVVREFLHARTAWNAGCKKA